MTDNLEIAKMAPSLSGWERARFIIKDKHERICGKGGFLSDADIEALWRIDDSEMWEEFQQCRKMYSLAPEVWLSLITVYQNFLVAYYRLNDVRFKIAASRGLRDIADFLKESLAQRGNESVELKIRLPMAIKFLEAIQPIEVKEQPDKLIVKDESANFLKDTVSQIYEEACNAFALIEVVKKINEEIGFDAFEWLGQETSPQLIRIGILSLIEEHNTIIQSIAGQILEHLEDYLIPEPIVDKQEYAGWEERLLKRLY
jgi:hypothetical protein